MEKISHLMMAQLNLEGPSHIHWATVTRWGAQTFVGLYDDCLDVHPTLNPWFITHIEAI